uniref:ZP domain-containing protein n=1 Tax=Caenorhabditis tropicalis TaxID=1561998 RepID=A0A1I7U7K7_9PELO
MRFLAVLLVPLVLAEICPMENHAVCNTGHLACVCSVSQEDENPVPEVSCNALIARDLETGNFPVVSVEFTLKNSADALEEFPEEAFKDKISSSLRVDEEDIVVLRTSCQGTDDTITVQFVILKKDTNSSALPFAIEDLIDAQSITTRMKAMGHLDEIANLDVDSIEYTDELVDLEFDPSNLELIFKAVLLFLVFGFFFILGIWKLMKKGDEYADDLQKP